MRTTRRRKWDFRVLDLRKWFCFASILHPVHLCTYENFVVFSVITEFCLWRSKYNIFLYQSYLPSYWATVHCTRSLLSGNSPKAVGTVSGSGVPQRGCCRSSVLGDRTSGGVQVVTFACIHATVLAMVSASVPSIDWLCLEERKAALQQASCECHLGKCPAHCCGVSVYFTGGKVLHPGQSWAGWLAASDTSPSLLLKYS